MPEIGQTISHYRIVEKIGQGGMGEVYLAHDTSLDRKVAVKFFPESLKLVETAHKRFMREAKSAAALDHPYICSIHEVGEVEGRSYIVMEYVEGQTLKDKLAQGEVPLKDAMQWSIEIAEALTVAHEKGIIHRDLKPSNIMISRTGHAKVMDFGLAKQLYAPSESGSQEETLTGLTREGTTVGTIPYMSPEQVQGKAIDLRSDLFSFGIVIYEMLTGVNPFKRDSKFHTADAIVREDPAPISKYRDDVPQPLSALIQELLSKDPRDRYQQVREAADNLKKAHDEAFGQQIIITRPAFAGIRKALRKPVYLIPLILVVAAAAYFLVQGVKTYQKGKWAREGAAQQVERPAIAVLPFVNLSADPEQEYFCDGIAEEIINALAHVEGLRVIARTSSFAFKGKSEDMREIGSKLAVESLLEGSVRRAGNRLRISAQLINVADGSHLWSERYDRQLMDVFAIQDEIALAIVANLKITLLHHERAAIVRRQTESVEAHNEYLRALHYWSSFTPEGFARSRECLTRAIQIDPQFAEAYSFIAGWQLSQTYWGDVPPHDSVEVARSMAEKALTFDDADDTAYGVLGLIRGTFEADAEAGERLLKKSAALGPSNANAQLNLGVFLSLRGRYKEAVEYIRLAQLLDPLSPNTNAWSAGILVECGLVDEGVGELEKLVALMPGFWLAHYELARAYQSCSHLAEARAPGEKAVQLSAGASMAVARLACICYQAGDTSRGDEVFAQLKKRSEEAYVAPSVLAWVHMARGENDQAARLLEQARETNDPMFVMTRVYTRPFFPSGSAVDAILKKAGW
jgi:TolB-like protein/Flp pilus assembly protein TadD/predicted Ser/Thr protein kinase